MQVWVPSGNQMSINEVRSSNLWDRTYWDAYFEEQDLEVRETMLAGFDSPNFKMQDRRLSDLDDAWEPFEKSYRFENSSDAASKHFNYEMDTGYSEPTENSNDFFSHG